MAVPLDIKPGDELTVRVSVRAVTSEGIRIAVIGNDSAAHLPLSHVVSHTPAPKPLAAGDCVAVHGDRRAGQILSIDDGFAWVRWGRRDRSTVALGVLVRR